MHAQSIIKQFLKAMKILAGVVCLWCLILFPRSAQANEIVRLQARTTYFEPYILKAVEYLNRNYGLKGYDINSAFTHELSIGDQGVLKPTRPPLTMCVAAQLEIIATAIRIYVEETGHREAWEYLPFQSWRGYSVNDFRGHVWVNSKFNSNGTADALKNFGMGESVELQQLKPGSFINFNRENRTGHAVVFMGFIDRWGKIYSYYNTKVIGFKYFSAQGGRGVGEGGYDFRYAVFKQHGCPDTLPGKRDCGIVYSSNQKYFTAGRMWAPKSWKRPQKIYSHQDVESLGVSVFDSQFFNGQTTDH